MLFKTHDVSFKRIFQIQTMGEKLCISSRLQLEVQSELKWFEPYLSERPERWVIEGPVMVREQVIKIFQFYDYWDNLSWNFTEDMWNPEGISEEFDENIVPTYRTIKSMFESKMEKDPHLPEIETSYVELIRENLYEVLVDKKKFNKVALESLLPRSQKDDNDKKSTVLQNVPISP
jgi:hypothetical protein